MKTRRLTLPAPTREWYWTGEGWASRRWTEEGVRSCISGGGWFQKGRSSFENLITAKLAGDSDG